MRMRRKKKPTATRKSAIQTQPVTTRSKDKQARDKAVVDMEVVAETLILKKTKEPSAALKSTFEKQPTQAKRHSRKKKEVIYPAVIGDDGVEIPLAGWTEVYISIILTTFNVKGYINIPNHTLYTFFLQCRRFHDLITQPGVKSAYVLDVLLNNLTSYLYTYSGLGSCR